VAETPVSDPAAAEELPAALTEADPRTTFLYRFASEPVRLVRRLARRPSAPLDSADFYTDNAYTAGEEIQAALGGMYGATTRVSAGGQISVTLYSAIPVVREGQPVGAILVSQSTFRILQDIYQIRLDVFRIFLICFSASIVLSLFLSLTIARPIAILQQRAREAVDEHGRLLGPIPRTRRRDEIGGLSLALTELTSQVDRYTRELESFAADASHELRNPLASIRASCEMALETDDEEIRRKFLEQARLDVNRAEAIIRAMRELSVIDAGADPRAISHVGQVLEDAVMDARRVVPDHPVTVAVDEGVADQAIPLSDYRIHQIVRNLLENSAAFGPPGSSITVTATRGGSRQKPTVVIHVDDEGPGFGDEDLERIFNRFYSTRDRQDSHLGLGLPIVRSLAQGAGGTATATNRETGGARVTVELPTVDEKR
ncbi:MAG: hypothetical protein E4H09_03830, partial [Spirochaetales bacterium]